MSEENPVDAPEQVEETAEEQVPVEEPDSVEEEPPKPKRGRPKGSKNKPKVQVVSVEEEEEEALEPILEAPPKVPPQPKLKRQTNRQPKAKAAPAAQEPAPPAQIDIASYMLHALGQQQQERADRKREKYARWFS